jgi:hypothetical protein
MWPNLWKMLIVELLVLGTAASLLFARQQYLHKCPAETVVYPSTTVTGATIDAPAVRPLPVPRPAGRRWQNSSELNELLEEMAAADRWTDVPNVNTRHGCLQINCIPCVFWLCLSTSRPSRSSGFSHTLTALHASCSAVNKR